MAFEAIIIDKLKSFGLKLGVVETSTNGMICSTLATYKDYEYVFKAGIIVNDSSILYKFGIENDDKLVSRSKARKFAKFIHDEYDCDVAIGISSLSNDPNLKDIPIDENKVSAEEINNPNGHAYISILVVDKYEDFELQFKSKDEIKDRLLITSKALNELLYVVMKLK